MQQGTPSISNRLRPTSIEDAQAAEAERKVKRTSIPDLRKRGDALRDRFILLEMEARAYVTDCKEAGRAHGAVKVGLDLNRARRAFDAIPGLVDRRSE